MHPTSISEHQEPVDSPKEAAFAQQNQLMDTICSDSRKGLDSFLQSLPAEQYESLFGQGKECADKITACVDEGISLLESQQGRLRIAGSGILLGKERAQQLWKLSGITTVTAHQGCGAAALYCQEHAPDQRDPSRYVADILRQWAEEVGLKFEYITVLDRPDFHSARAVSVVSTPDFRPNEVKLMPKSFVVSADGTAKEVADDAILSAKIALGDHGFQNKFNPEQPFVIALIGTVETQDKMDHVYQQINNDDWFQHNQARLLVQSTTVVQPSQSELAQAA